MLYYNNLFLAIAKYLQRDHMLKWRDPGRTPSHARYGERILVQSVESAVRHTGANKIT